MSPGNYVKSPSNASAAIEGLYSPGHVRTAKHCYGTSNPVYVCYQKWKSLHVVSRRRVVSHGFLKWIVVIRADKSVHSVRVITSCSGWLRKTAMRSVSHAGQWIDRCWHVKILYKQRVLMHGHQGWNVRHGLCHIYMIYVYIWVVYSFCLFCCLFIIVTTQFVALYKPCKPKPKPSTYA